MQTSLRTMLRVGLFLCAVMTCLSEHGLAQGPVAAIEELPEFPEAAVTDAEWSVVRALGQEAAPPRSPSTNAPPTVFPVSAQLALPSSVAPPAAPSTGPPPAEAAPSVMRLAADSATADPAQQLQNELQALRAQMDRYEQELAKLRVTTAPAGEAELTSLHLADEKKSGDSKSDKKKDEVEAVLGGPAVCKEVEIIDKPTYKIGTKIYFDNGNISQSQANEDQLGDLQNYTGMRTVRFSLRGFLYENIDYKVEVDFASQFSGTVLQQDRFTDVYTTFLDRPILGNIRVGHFKEPIGMDQLTPDDCLPFMERALPDIFVPARRWGVMVFKDFNDNQNYTGYLGTFREGARENVALEVTDIGDWGITGRFAATPYYDEPSEGRYLIHTGIAAMWSGAAQSTLVSLNNLNYEEARTFSARPESRFNNFVSTRTIPAHDYSLLDAELAFQYGSWWGQSEFVLANVNAKTLPNQTFTGYYIETGYILTGESKGYDREQKVFRSVKPYTPIFRIRSGEGFSTGWGAWEVAYRYSWVNLFGDDLPGSGFGALPGRLTDHTVGLNWYMTEHLRFQFNYIHAQLSSVATAISPRSDASTFDCRLMYSF